MRMVRVTTADILAALWSQSELFDGVMVEDVSCCAGSMDFRLSNGYEGKLGKGDSIDMPVQWDAGEGWEMLSVGAQIQEGDECRRSLARDAGRADWKGLPWYNSGAVVKTPGCWRRRKQEKPTAGEQLSRDGERLYRLPGNTAHRRPVRTAGAPQGYRWADKGEGKVRTHSTVDGKRANASAGECVLNEDSPMRRCGPRYGHLVLLSATRLVGPCSYVDEEGRPCKVNVSGKHFCPTLKTEWTPGEEPASQAAEKPRPAKEVLSDMAKLYSENLECQVCGENLCIVKHTRLERMCAGVEDDVYGPAHGETCCVTDGRIQLWVEGQHVKRLKDGGEVTLPEGLTVEGDWQPLSYIGKEPPEPLIPSDDMSGDDVAADAPGAIAYMERGNVGR